MGDEPVGDPDAMWKRGYSAPDDGTGLLDPEPNDTPRAWFAHYGRPSAQDPDDEGTPRDPDPAPDPEPMPLSGAEGAVERRDDDPSGQRDRRPRTLLVAATAMAVVAVGGVVWQVARDDVTVGGHRMASIPSRAVPAWTTELDTGHITGIIGTRSTIVVLELVSNDLVGLAADSGVERWRVKAAPSRSIARLEEADGAAIVLVEENTGDRSIAAYDVESGARLWREEGLDRSAFVAFQGSVYRIPAGVTDVAIERLDPLTGDGLNAVASDLSSVGWAHVATVRDDVVEVFDLQTLARVGGPIEIGSVAAATAFDGRVVGLGRDATIRMYGSAGDELSSLQITVDRPAQFDIAFTPEPVLIVMDDDEMTGYSLLDDRIAQIWTIGPVQVNEITEVGDHTYAVVQTVVAAGPSGGPVRVVDAATGVAVAEPSGGNGVRLGRDGFVVEITDDDGVRQAIEAYGYDGDRRWRFDLTREQQGLFLVDGAVVLVASDTAAQKSTLTYLN